MSFETYRLIHFIGLLFLFMGLGGAVFHRGEGKAPGMALVLHGLGWVVAIVAGFGMMARREDLSYSSGWLITKIVILVLLGVLPILVRKKIVPKGTGWLIAAVCGAAAVWLVISKPF